MVSSIKRGYKFLSSLRLNSVIERRDLLKICSPFMVLTTVGKKVRGTQREYSSKPLKHGIVKLILVFER